MLIEMATYFGYLASLMLILALLVKSDLNFRYYNIAGNICFIIYAIILNAIPVLITNVILLGINAYFAYKLITVKESFELMTITGNEALIQRFIEFHQADIQRYFPNFQSAELSSHFNFVVLRDLVIANIFSARILPDGKAEVVLNYTVPRYRDFKIGTFIFEREKDFLLKNSISQIYYPSVVNPSHKRFLKKMKFNSFPEGAYSRSLYAGPRWRYRNRNGLLKT